MTRFLASGSALVPLIALACGPLALEPHPRERQFESAFDQTPDRVWIGEHYWANRLQDWRIEEGELACVEARPRFGMRTLQLLTCRIAAAGEGSFRTRAIIDGDAGDRGGSAAGFLVGAGGEHVDYRVTSQVHGTSAEDGGWLALVDADGRARIATFEESIPGNRGQWTMTSQRELNDFAAPDGVVVQGPGFGAEGPRPVEVEASGAQFDSSRTFQVVVRDVMSQAVLSTATWANAPTSLFDGSIGLVSHRGPRDVAGAPANGYRFRAWRTDGDLLRGDASRAFGPILFVHYTVDEAANGSARLRMTAQTGPLGDGDTQAATLELRRGGDAFEAVSVAPYTKDSATFHFDVPGLDPAQRTEFRVVYAPTRRDGTRSEDHVQRYEGVIPARPSNDGLTLALLSCQKSYTGGLKWNENGIWFPHDEVARHVAAHEPDLLYFAGDQIYEGDLTPAIRRPMAAALNDYLHKWFRHGWSFGELTRRLPAVVVPDDHDVYHGNIWGNAGVRMEAPKGVSQQDRGGYVMPPTFVNAVHRTQVAHLPAPAHAAPLDVGISRYHTTLTWGGGSFAILADRMDKSPPAMIVPDGKVKNGWFQAEDYDPAVSADVEGATLLGADQLEMLADWGADWPRGAWFKACLSQTPFANVATIPKGANSGSVIPSLKVPLPGEYVLGDKQAADTDSNGWPQTGRNTAVRLLRAAGAFHLTGDQHLGSTLRYGVDAFDDAGFVLSSPAVANTWPRRWFPDPGERQPGPEVAPGAPDYTGRYLDGFGNRMTVYAIANPRDEGVAPERLHGRAPGYGIVRVERGERATGGGRVTLEAWPRHRDPLEPGAAPFEGWPVTVPLEAADGRAAAGTLPLLSWEAGEPVIVQVRDGAEVLYTRRIERAEFAPPVFRAGAGYEVRLRRQGSEGWSQVLEGLGTGGQGGPAGRLDL